MISARLIVGLCVTVLATATSFTLYNDSTSSVVVAHSDTKRPSVYATTSESVVASSTINSMVRPRLKAETTGYVNLPDLGSIVAYMAIEDGRYTPCTTPYSCNTNRYLPNMAPYNWDVGTLIYENYHYPGMYGNREINTPKEGYITSLTGGEWMPCFSSESIGANCSMTAGQYGLGRSFGKLQGVQCLGTAQINVSPGWYIVCDVQGMVSRGLLW